MLSRKIFRGSFALPIILVLAGCSREDAAQTSQTVPSDSSGVVSEIPSDTVGPVADSGEARVETSGGPAPETAEQTLSADSVPTLADLSDRIGRLEAENDSLRIALHTLLPLMAARGETDPALEADTASQDEILPVDGREVRNWGARSLLAVVFLALTVLMVRVLAWILEKLAERSAKRRLFFKRLIPILRIFLWAFAGFFVVRVIFNVGGQELLAASAAVGVAVGFAAQDILKNIFGGVLVLFDQPFQVGDKISVGGTYGEVVSIGLRSTRIVTPDDNLVTVPNAQVVDGQVANANAGELNCQVVTDLFLPGWVDEAEAKKIAFDAAASSRFVYLNKPIVVLIKDKFEDTFITQVRVKAYVLDPRYEFLFMSDVTERARAGFRAAGLLGPMHGVRAYVDVDRFPEVFKKQGNTAGEGERDEL